MADLKTNYVDDVLDTTKNQLRKYQQIQNDDGTVSFVDVTEYTQVGTSFGAKDINDTNAAINEVNGKLGNNHRKIDTVSLDSVFPFIPEFTGIFFGLINCSSVDAYMIVVDENGSGLGSVFSSNGTPLPLIFPFENGKKVMLSTNRNINGFYSISKVQLK